MVRVFQLFSEQQHNLRLPSVVLVEKVIKIKTLA